MEKKLYDLTSPQKSIWFTEQYYKNTNINNVCGVFETPVPIDFSILEKSIKQSIKENESYRTRLTLKNGEIKQYFSEYSDFHIETVFLNSNKERIELEKAENSKGFQLLDSQLFKFTLFKYPKGNGGYIINSSHIISDSWSSGFIINEITKIYNTLKNKNEPLIKNNDELAYSNYIKSEQDYLASEKFIKDKEYWNSVFETIPEEVATVPSIKQNKSTNLTYKAQRYLTNIDSNKLEKLQKYAQKNKVSLYNLLIGIFSLYISRVSNLDDFVIGTPILNRSNFKEKHTTGMFINVLPLRINVDSSLKFKDFTSKIATNSMGLLRHQRYSYNYIIEDLRKKNSSIPNLYNIMISYQITKMNEDNDILPHTVDWVFNDSTVNDLDIHIFEWNGENTLKIAYDYKKNKYSEKEILNLHKRILHIIDQLLENEDLLIKDIEIITKEEKNKILYEFNNTKADYPKGKTISQLFEEQVEKTPNNIALVFEDKQLTYKELNEKANQLAHYLRNIGINRNDIVGILVNRSLEMIISILAILKSGGTYIPIDPEYPQDRIEYMLNNSSSKVLLTFKNLDDKVVFNNKILVELSNNEIYSLSKDNLENINEPDDSSYIIYTSGSTGLPKGVVLKHKSLTNLQNYLKNNFEFFQGKNQKNVVSVTTISFDIFLFETIMSLTSGLKVVICNEEEQYMPKNLYKLLEKHNIEILQMTPSRMRIFLDNLENIKKLAKIKYVVLAGEALPYSLVQKLKDFGVKKIYNGYGPSETTVFSTFTDVTDLNNINIGKPLSNTQIYILDKNLLPCPINIPGELYISGDGVGNGYLNRPDLTEKSFVPNPFIQNTLMYKTGDFCKFLPTGEIEYLERIDNQVKIRGLRIELDEIETKILDFPNIKKACVIKQTINNRDFISAYFTIKKRINISELRQYLSNYLPKYMVPSYFTILEEFPYTPNGKIDKKALPLPNEILSNFEKKYIAPKTDLQIKLVTIFEQILNIKPIGINDNFFELGGDSILAMSLNIELKKLTDKINYSDIFKFPSVSELENKINSSEQDYDFKYLEKNYNKYSELLNNNLKIPKLKELKYHEAGNVLLTGVTGFLGIHILESFIKNEKGNIYCIIRKEASLTAELKLQQKLHYYFGDKYDKLIGKRIFAITGDICSLGFGLGQEELLELSNNIDIVINSAAKVSHYGNYSDFYNINVLSVKYITDFCKSFNKKLYHISTLSVSGNSIETTGIIQNIKKETIFQENNLFIGQSLENVYVRSKFEAECIVLDSILEGLDGYILRMGNLMPRFKDGIFQENILDNAYINRITAFLKIGAIPDYIKNNYLEFTPIDLSANSIIKLITHSNKNNRIFHLFNHNHVYLNKIIDFINNFSEFELEIIDEETFKNKIRKILKNSKTQKILNFLINDFDKQLHLIYFTDIIIKSENTIKYLEKIGFSWPNITDRYLTNFINLLRMVL